MREGDEKTKNEKRKRRCSQQQKINNFCTMKMLVALDSKVEV